MTRFDLHPEDLLERASRGRLTLAETARLEQHLAQCDVCRVERALKRRAAIDSQPLPDEQLVVARVKRDVMRRLQSPQRRPPRRVLWLAAFGATTLAGAAAASVLVFRANWSEPPEPAIGETISAAAVRAPARAVAAAAVDSVSSEHATSAPAAPVMSTTEGPAAVKLNTPLGSRSEPPSSAVTTSGPTSAAETFSLANQARREGRVKDAVRLYRTLQERFSGSSEELVSRVLLGRLLLDRLHDSGGALAQFNSYLASPGQAALREEALVGRALALGRLGRVTEERAAWSALLDAFPGTTQAARARARTRELDARLERSPR